MFLCFKSIHEFIFCVLKGSIHKFLLCVLVPELDEVDDEFDMYASYGSKTSPATMVPRELYLAQKEGNFLTGFGAEDRPITPLKDKMIYDPVNSSLDFKDGEWIFFFT